MNRKHLLEIGLLSAAAMLLTGCSAEIFDGHSGQVPIYLTASVQEGGAQGMTRAGTDVQSTQLPDGEEFYGYFPSGATVSNATFTADGSGGTTADPQPYFTLSGTETTVHAYHGKSGGTDQVTNETTSFSVATDQSSDEAYKASDLMYATATVTKSGLSATGELTFSHKMAKIIVNATMGSGITSITAVKIVGGYRTVNISDATTCALGTTLSGDNSSANITVYFGTHTSGTLSCAALIPPQTVSGNFLQIVTNAGTVTYSLNGKQFDSNNVYTFNVTLTASQAGTTVAITDWANNGSVYVTNGGGGLPLHTSDSNSNGYVTFSSIADCLYTGLAYTPEPSVMVKINNISIPLTKGTDFDYSYQNNVNEGTATVSVTGKGLFSGTVSTTFNISICQGAALSTANVGDIICSHGRVHAATSDDLTTCSGHKVAIVAYKGSAGSADTSTGSDSYIGLALAITDVGGANSTAFVWGTERLNYGDPACITNGLSTDWGTASGTSGDWLKGIDNTNRLANAECNNGHVHPAAQQAVGYESTDPHPAGTSQWFLPTIAQWKLMVESIRNNMNSSDTNTLSMSEEAAFENTEFQTWFDERGGRNFIADHYWSSVEYTQFLVWNMCFNNGRAYYHYKDSSLPVRAVLAF